MAITITIDNDTSTPGTLDSLVLDESGSLQLPNSADSGNDSDLGITGDTVAPFDATLVGAAFSAPFLSFLNAATIFGSAGLRLTDAQKAYAAGVEGSVSSSNFVTVTTSQNEVISDLIFSDSAGAALNGDQVVGMKTLDDQNVYLWSDGNYCIATTSNVAGAGRVVAAFYLNEAGNHLTAQVQMATFEPLLHPVTSNHDDALNFTNVLNVSALGTLSFNFDILDAGKFLWAAIGNEAHGLLITGLSLDVDGNGKAVSNSSDFVNTSQGGLGATIGIDNQMFENGNVGVITLVDGFEPLPASGLGQAHSDYVVDKTQGGNTYEGINYTGYTDVSGAKLFFSQDQGSGTFDCTISLWEAGGASGTPEQEFGYIGTEPNSAILDDTAVNVGTVTVYGASGTPGVLGAAIGTWAVSGGQFANGSTHGGVTVTITANGIDINGLDAFYTVGWTVLDDPNVSGDETFNRIRIQADAGKFDIGRLDLDQGVAQPQAIGGSLIVHDDGPSITSDTTGAPSITVDESVLTTNNSASYAANFTAVFGTDGAGATPKSYSLSTPGGNSGLTDTITGNPVFLFKVGDNIVGKAGADATAAASGPTVFVVSIDQTGQVTLDQQRAVVHDPNTGPDQSTTLGSAGAVVVNASAFDGDGDSASAALNIGQLLNFKDDAPTITAQILGDTVNFIDGASVSHSLNGSVRADVNNATEQSLSGVFQYTIIGFNEPTGVFANLDGVLTNGNTVLTYYTDGTHTTAVYRLTLDQTDGAAGSYTFEVLEPPPIVQINFDFTDLPSGQNLFGVIAQDKADLSKGGLLVMPNNPDINDPGDGQMTNASGTVNTSKGGGPVTIGNGNQAFDNLNEGAFFCYVDNPLASAVGGLGLTQVTADDADFVDFNGTNEVTTASVEIVQASGGGTVKRPGPSLQIFAWDIDPGLINTDAASRGFLMDPSLGGIQSNIIGCKILDSAGNVVEYRTNDQQGASNGGTLAGGANAVVDILFVLDDDGDPGLDDDIYSVLVSNLKQGYTIEFVTEEGHDLALVENRSGSYDIGGFNIKNNVNLPAQEFDFQVQISDYDNDTFASALSEFSVTVAGISF